MIRKGKMEDIDTLMKIVRDTVHVMKEEENDQWDETYPNGEIFHDDVHAGALNVLLEDGEIIGSITVDRNEPDEYQTIPWHHDGPAYTFHRLVVTPFKRGKGAASQLIRHAEQIAKNQNVPYMRIDTYSLNKKAQQLFEKMGFQKAGEMSFHGKKLPFYCYEKKLT